MTAIFEKVTGVLLFRDGVVTDTGVRASGFFAPQYTTENAEAIDVEIPADAIPGVSTYSGGVWSVTNQGSYDAIAAQELTSAKARKLQQIRKDFQRSVDALFADYTPQDRDSFAKQEEQARSFLANIDEDRTDLPLLKSLANARGVTMEVQAGRIVTKAEAAEAPYGAILGARQAREDALAAATSIAEVEAA